MTPCTRVIRVVIAAVLSGGTVITAASCVTRVPEPLPSPSVAPSPERSPAEPGPARSATRSGEPTAGQLQRVLLTAADMPGFTASQTNDKGSSPGCPALDSDFSDGSSASAEVLLTSAGSVVFIRERLRQYSESGARTVVSRIADATTTCATFTDTQPTLGTMVVTVTTLPQPPRGDESAALRLTFKSTSLNVTLFEDLVVIRRGGTLLLLTHVSPITIDDNLTTSTTGKAYTKLAGLW